MAIGTDRRTALRIEVGVVVAFFVLPSLTLALTNYIWPNLEPGSTSFGSEIRRFTLSAGQILVVLFIVWGSGDKLSGFGLRGNAWERYIPIALVAFVAHRITSHLSGQALHAVAPAMYSSSIRVITMNRAVHPQSLAVSVVRVVTIVVGAFCEEFIMRGYLITRLRELLGNLTLAVLVAAVLFASYHIYEGPVAVVAIFLAGVIYGCTFLVTNSLIPGTIAHSLHNILLILVRTAR